MSVKRGAATHRGETGRSGRSKSQEEVNGCFGRCGIMMRKMVIVVMGCVWLSGCSHIPFWKKQTDNPVAVTDTTASVGTPSAVSGNLNGAYDGLSLCQSELKSLQGVDSKLYQHHKAQLESNLARASQYIVMRPGLSGDMQSVMDSVYQAQIARTCQQIHADLFASLLKQADGR